MKEKKEREDYSGRVKKVDTMVFGKFKTSLKGTKTARDFLKKWEKSVKQVNCEERA